MTETLNSVQPLTDLKNSERETPFRTFASPLIVGLLLFFSTTVPSYGLGLRDIGQIGMAFLTNMAIHESGHYFMASTLGAQGNSLNFFTVRNGSFFLGLSTYTKMEKEGRLPYHLAGEFAASQTFEYALYQYRRQKTTYFNALTFFSSTDFLFYSLYAFYLSPKQEKRYDPVSIAEDTGLSQEVIFSIALTQTLLNGLRIYFGKDYLIPYFTIDQDFASFNIKFNF